MYHQGLFAHSPLHNHSRLQKVQLERRGAEVWKPAQEPVDGTVGGGLMIVDEQGPAQGSVTGTGVHQVGR